MKVLYFPFIHLHKHLCWMMMSGSILDSKNKHKWVRPLSIPQNNHRLVRKSECRMINMISIELCGILVERLTNFSWIGKERLINVFDVWAEFLKDEKTFTGGEWWRRIKDRINSNAGMVLWKTQSFCRAANVQCGWTAKFLLMHVGTGSILLSPTQGLGCSNWYLSMLL